MIGGDKGVRDNEGLVMKEIEIGVSDFEQTKEFLVSSGFVIKLKQDKERTRWRKKDVF